jgi:hypothetical protein
VEEDDTTANAAAKASALPAVAIAPSGFFEVRYAEWNQRRCESSAQLRLVLRTKKVLAERRRKEQVVIILSQTTAASRPIQS